MKVWAARCVAAVPTSRTVPRKTPASRKSFHPPFPIHSRGRLIEPHAVVVDDTPGRKDRRERIDDQSWIKVLEVARADNDGGNQ